MTHTLGRATLPAVRVIRLAPGVTLLPQYARVYTNEAREVRLTQMQSRLVEAVAAAGSRGITPELCIDALYNIGADVPLGGRRIVHQFRVGANKRLAAIGLRITTSYGHLPLYRLEAIS